MASKNTPATTQGASAAKAAGIMQAFSDLIMQVPEAADDDGSGIIARILDATSLEDLQAGGELPSSKDLTGRQLAIETIHRRRSDKGDGTGWYLVCEGYEGPKRTPITFSAGGSEALARISQAYVLGLFPIVVEFSSVQTRSGNDAINTKIVAAGGQGRTIDG